MSSPSTNNSSLRPAWNRGGSSNPKGFQPPPTVRSRSVAAAPTTTSTEEKRRTSSAGYNKFAALDEDDDEAVAAAVAAVEDSSAGTGGGNNSRSLALRSRSGSTASGGGGGAHGRSLADLEAASSARKQHPPSTTGSDAASSTVKITRITRERLLSLRPQPRSEAPERMRQELAGNTVIMSEAAQDPVCWDSNFEPEEIWAKAARERRASQKLMREASGGTGMPAADASARRTSTTSRRVSSTDAGGRWQRGVALPPPSESLQKKTRSDSASNPNDLWDDPLSSAASDFSAFGAMPTDEEGPKKGPGPSDDDVFDFEKMAAASARLQEELHGTSTTEATTPSGGSDEDESAAIHSEHKVNPSRPLASIGTTIRSGSGDDVNVFEDFDDDVPGSEATDEKAPAATEDNASSRLMAMIGVTKDEGTTADPAIAGGGSEPTTIKAWGEPKAESAPTRQSLLSSNPWGGPLIPGAGSAPTAVQQQQPQQGGGLDLQARLREAAEAEQAAERRRQEEEEAKRRALLQQQQQQAAQQQQQQQAQQQVGVQSQVENVLVERISTILENSWGRADLMSVLTTLHSEDSRVVPLLNSVDALRTLILRNPRRIALRQDPALHAEIAVLLVTNTQWAQQQQEQQARAQQEELQRREQERRAQEQQRLQSELRSSVVPGAPWYYSDPQQNIQGPFRGDEMRQWLEAGYFKGDLPVSQQPNGPFHPLSLIYTDLSRAFMHLQPSPEEEARQKAEEERKRREAERAEAEARERAELERKAREAADAAERERQAKEAQVAAERDRLAKESAAKKSNGGNESSTQLKMMLGVPEAQAAAAQTGPTPSSGKEGKKSKGKNKKDKEPQPETSSSADTKGAAPAWGAANQNVKRKSMAEIQKEEARAAAIATMQQKGSRQSSSGWANVAASRGGSSAWAGGTAKQTPAAVLTTPAAAAPAQAPRAKSMPASAAKRQVAASSQQKASSPGSTAADEFGAKMSPAFEQWCKDQMQKLNGTDDLTLVSFCMTLNDASEIRQYLTAYLGSTPQVNSFATEFINRKGGSRGQQEEWETTATSKKSKKKKGGGR